MFEIPSCTLNGTVRVPPSKSIAQRLIIMAAFADSDSFIQNAGTSGDVLSTIQAMELLGTVIETHNTKDSGSVSLSITPASPSILHTNTIIDCGESATLARILAPLLPVAVKASNIFHKFIITGEKSLNNRPMAETERFLVSLGLTCHCANGYLPMELSGSLRAGLYHTDAPDSSQPVSGTLLALSLIHGNSLLVVRNPKSLPYIALTMDLANQYGARIEYESRAHNHVWHISGDCVFSVHDAAVENDWSAAAMLMAAAALHGTITVSAMNPRSLQADKKILELVDSFGADVSKRENPDGTADYTVTGNLRKPFSAELSDSPDLFPAAALLASGSDGECILHGTHRLGGKESNRGEALCHLINGLGATCSVTDNTMRIQGTRHFHECVVTLPPDHRIIMSAVLASSALPKNASIHFAINGNDSIDTVLGKSYPGFIQDFNRLGGEIHEQSG